MFVSNVTIRCILNATRSLSVPHDPYEADRTVKLDSRSKSKAAPEPVAAISRRRCTPSSAS